LRELIRRIETKPAGIDCAENVRRIIKKMAKAPVGKANRGRVDAVPRSA